MTQTIEVEEAAQLLKCSPMRVREGLKLREIPGVKIGKEWVIMREAFFTALNDMAAQNLKPLPGPKVKVASPRPNR